MIEPKLLIVVLHICVCGWSGLFWQSSANALEPNYRQFINDCWVHNQDQHSNASISAAEAEFLWSMVNTVLLGTGVVAMIASTFILKHIGKKDLIALVTGPGNIMAAVCLWLGVEYQNLYLVYVSRALGGAVFAFGNIVPSFLAEITPVEDRDMVFALSLTTMRSWAIISNVVNMPQLGVTNENWHYRSLFMIVIGLFLCVGRFVIPESPKYEYICRHNHNQAKKSFDFYYRKKSSWELTRHDMEQEAELSSTDSGAGLWQIMSTPHMRWPLLISCVTTSVTVCAGAPVFTAYFSGMLQQHALDVNTSILVCVLGLWLPATFASLSSVVINRIFNKRKMFIWTLASFAIGWSLIGLAETYDKWWLIAGTVFVQYIVYSACAGPQVFGYTAELCPQASLATSITVSITFEAVLFTAAAFLYPMMNLTMGAYKVIPFIVLSVTYALFCAKWLPDTTGLTVDQVVSRNWHRMKVIPQFSTASEYKGKHRKMATISGLVDGQRSSTDSTLSLQAPSERNEKTSPV